MKNFKVIANTKDLSREEWLKIRKGYIGGSDAGAVCGLNPWRSAMDVWMDKTSDRLEEKEATYKMKLGNLLEETVARLFEEETGKKVRRNHAMMVSTKWPWMLADIDREIVGENAILECKTTSGYNKDQWKDGEVPISYQLQVHHYMAVTGAEKAYIACMIGFEDFVVREIERDEETIAMMVEAEEAFYEGLKDPKKPLPPPDGSVAYTEALNAKYSHSVANEEPLEIDVDMSRYFELEEAIKDLEEKKEVIAQTIKKEMGEKELAHAEGAKITWKEFSSSRFQSKEFKKDHPELYKDYTKTNNYRRFTVKKVQEAEEEK